MAFDRSRWSRQTLAFNTGQLTLADGTTVVDGPAVFTYQSASDDVATIQGSNYFGAAAYDLKPGDFIWVNGAPGTNPFASYSVTTMYKVASVDRNSDPTTVAISSVALNNAVIRTGGIVTKVTDTTFTISPGTTTSDFNGIVTKWSSDLTIDLETVGANGWIANPATNLGLGCWEVVMMVDSSGALPPAPAIINTAGTLVTGYNDASAIAQLIIDNTVAPGVVVNQVHSLNNGTREFVLDTPLPLLSLDSSITFEDLDVTANGDYWPQPVCTAFLEVTYSPDTPGTVAYLRPKGFSEDVTNWPIVEGAQLVEIIPNGDGVIQWVTPSASDTLTITLVGFRYSLV